MRRAGAARALVVAAGLLALGARDAAGETLAVQFAGTFRWLSGAPVSIPFTGGLFYDAAVPDSSEGGVNFYEFAPGAAGLRIETATGSFASDPASSGVFAMSLPVHLDANGDPTGPNDPDAVLGAFFRWGSSANLPADALHLSLDRFIAEHLPDGFPLPTAAEELAAVLVGAIAGIDASSGFMLSGTITAATPIPEPATGALVGLGSLLLALSRTPRARRNAPRGLRACRRRSRA